MGKYTRNCGSDCEVGVMEVKPVPEIENSGSVKRRKTGDGELRLCSVKSERVTGCDDYDYDDDVTSFCSGDRPASCCSSNESITAIANCVDLEVEIGITERIESSPTSNLKEEESSKMESKPKPKPKPLAKTTDSRRIIPKEKMPPAAEIEAFFANAEKDLQKRFKDKYNYDIVKDVPLKGRFEWEKVKP